MSQRQIRIGPAIDFIANNSGTLFLAIGAYSVFGANASPDSHFTVGLCTSAAGLAFLALNLRILRSSYQIESLQEEIRALRNRQVQDEVQILNQKNG